MTPADARRAADGILIAAGLALAVLVWRRPHFRAILGRMLLGPAPLPRPLPFAIRDIRPIHVAAVIAALAAADGPGSARAVSRRREADAIGSGAIGSGRVGSSPVGPGPVGPGPIGSGPVGPGAVGDAASGEASPAVSGPSPGWLPVRLS